MIKKGDRVHIKPEWLLPGEEKEEYHAAEDQRDGVDKINIFNISQKDRPIVPIERILIKWLETPNTTTKGES